MPPMLMTGTAVAAAVGRSTGGVSSPGVDGPGDAEGGEDGRLDGGRKPGLPPPRRGFPVPPFWDECGATVVVRDDAGVVVDCDCCGCG